MTHPQNISRRKFLGTASCAAVGSVTLLSSLMSLRATSALAAPSYRMGSAPHNDYRALVCILMSGGNDSFNMLVPTDDDPFKAYQKTRSNQSLKKNDLLAINASNTTEQFGLHPAMPEVRQQFEAGNIAFINNIGTLIEHVPSVDAFHQGFAKLPLGLFSHADQIQQWQTSIPGDRTGIGWGGRMADLLRTSNGTSDISMGISLSGNNVFQAGNSVVPYSITGLGGSIGMNGYGGMSAVDQIRTTAVKGLLEQEYQDIFKQSYADVTLGAQENHESFSAAIGQVKLNTQFEADYFSQSMKMIARTIGARNTLGMRRQIFFVNYDGWDHHDELINIHHEMLGVLSKGLGAFQSSMDELGMAEHVTTFTISDFARTLTSNGNGTDHGWGGNALVMGGAVKGQQMFGQYPDLALRNPLDVGEGVLIPKLSTDQYFAELALWLGVAPSDLHLVLPNIGNFYDPMSGTAPLGFLL